MCGIFVFAENWKINFVFSFDSDTSESFWFHLTDKMNEEYSFSILY